jgi:hypothetical protein
LAKRANSVKQSLKWKWRGAATDAIDFGSPSTTTKYLLCIYDGVAGTPRLVDEKDVAPGQTCAGGAPCWQPTSKGQRYLDKGLSLSSVKLVDLRPGADGRASIMLQAAGPHLGLPSFPLAASPEVRIQFINKESGACWEASYGLLRKNTDSLVKAQTPGG